MTIDFNLICVSGLCLGLFFGMIGGTVCCIINTFFIVALGKE